jgi:hypothetical protein
MSRKSRKEQERLEHERYEMESQYCQNDSAFYGNIPGMMPIAAPAHMIQLTPIVQPIALVPYSTQQQPICTIYDDTDDYNY